MLKQFLQDDSIQNQPELLVYQTIYKYGPVTQLKISEKTKLNRLKVMRILTSFLEKGYILESGFAESGGGRPPLLYDINPNYFMVGINISRTHVSIALFNLRVKEIKHENFLLTKKHTPEYVFAQIIAIIKGFQRTYHIDNERLLGISVAAVGPLHLENGTFLNPDPFLSSGWENLSITKLLEEAFGVNVYLHNHAHVAALGEKKLRETSKNILYSVVGWSFGCSMIVNNNILNVDSGSTHGFGHMIIEPNGRKCLCGNHGCIQSYMTLRSIIDRIFEHNVPTKRDKSILLGEEITIYDVIQFLIDERESVDSFVMESAFYFGIALANIINGLQIETTFVSGHLVELYPDYFAKVKETVNQYVYEKNNTILHLSPIDKSKSALVGSAFMVLEQFALNE